MENKTQKMQVEVMQSNANAEPVAAKPVATEEVKQYIVNCYRCGAALNVKAGNVVYMCPVCNNLFRVRLGEKLVKDVSKEMKEAYVKFNIQK